MNRLLKQHISTVLLIVSLAAVYSFASETSGVAIRELPSIVILFDTSGSDTMVTVMDLQNAHMVTNRGDNCMIINQTFRLIITESVSIAPASDGNSIEVRVTNGLMDSYPYFRNAKGHELDGLCPDMSWNLQFLPTRTIRINGRNMTLKEASKLYPSIPTNASRDLPSKATVPSAKPTPLKSSEGQKTPPSPK